MEKSNQLGMNRTGVDMSPIHSKQMVSGNNFITPDMNELHALCEMEKDYIEQADGFGSVPMPGTLKGILKTTMEKIKGANPEVLINKLGERLAFERGGVRLYDHLIMKCEAQMDGTGSPLPMEKLRLFREQELKHFHMLKDAIEKLGADPTAMTPDADTAGVMSMGLHGVLGDPRSTVAQCLEAILTAELADRAGWELLIVLCKDLNLDDLVTSFEVALNEEQVHLLNIDEWHTRMVMSEAGV